MSPSRPVSSYLAFSPLPAGAGGNFLSHYSTVTDSFPLGNMVLYVARTFLTPFTGRTRDGPSGRNLFFIMNYE